ncbi:MAG: glycosyltransferase family 4 protein [Chloroflexota bacterium]
MARKIVPIVNHGVEISGAKQAVSRVCIVRQDYHPGDSRIENQAQSLIERGVSVDIICMKRAGESFTSKNNGIRIIRLPALKRLRGTILAYLLEYVIFWVITFFAVTILHFWRRYQLVQVCNLPDFLVFVAIFPKLTGGKVLVDFRECMPEMYAAKYRVSMASRPIQLLSWLEQACVRFSDGAVTCTEQMRQAIIERGAPPEKIHVMMNSVDPAKFNHLLLPDPESELSDTFNIVTHGSIIPRYGHETLIRAIALLRHDVPEVRLRILGRGQQQREIEALCHLLDLDDVIEVAGFVSFDVLMTHLRWAHVGAVTMVRNQETDLIHTLKMQEYMILGIPVVISQTTAVEAYFDECCVQFFHAGDPEDLAKALLKLRNDPIRRYQLAVNAYARCRLYSTASQKEIFANVVQEMIGSKSRSSLRRSLRRAHER